MDRRQFLTLTGAAGSVVVAGCSGGDNSTDAGSTDRSTLPSTREPTESTDETEVTPTEAEPDPPLYDTESYDFSGDGAGTSSAVELAAHLTLFSFDFETVPDTGGNKLALEVEDEPDQRFPVIETTVTSGLTARPVPDVDYVVDVETPGEWSVQIGQPSPSAEAIAAPPFTASGSGVDVVGPVQIDDGATVSLTHSKGDNGIWVNALAASDTADGQRDGVYLVMTEPPFEGERETDKTGTVYFEVLGAGGPQELIPDPGEWRITVE